MNPRTLIIPAAILAGTIAIVCFCTWNRPMPAESTPSSVATYPASANPETTVAATPALSSNTATFRESPPPPDPVPPAGVAKVTLGDRTVAPRNRVAHFERLKAAPEQEIPIEVSWPGDKTSTEVFCQAIAGGTIDSGGNAQRLAITPGQPVKFTFKVGHESGLYEIVLRRGTQEEVLEFWVPTSRPEDDPPSFDGTTLTATQPQPKGNTP